MPEPKRPAKPVSTGPPRPRGAPLYGLVGFGALSVVAAWSAPGTFYLAARLMKEPGKGEGLIAYARLYSIQFTPVVGMIALGVCLYSYFQFRILHLYGLAALWFGFGAWHWLLYQLAK